MSWPETPNFGIILQTASLFSFLKTCKKFLQTADQFQVLCINREQIKLYEGNRNVLDEIDLIDAVPTTIEAALGSELTEEHLTAASYNGPKYATPNMFHGHGGKKDEVDKDAERFFRVIDRAIIEHYSKADGLPLVLAALPEYHHLFQSVSHNKNLLKDGVKINPFAIDVHTLREKAWEVVEPSYNTQLNDYAEQFQLAKAKGNGSDAIQDISKAAVEGRVDVLLAEANRVIAGKIIDDTGSIEKNSITNPEVDDVLDDLGELVLKMGGKVVIVPADKMPSSSGAAAIYRY